jgi:beta-xylosidase
VGSTNAYTEDASGRPQYDWTIVDRILDTYVERKMKPLLELGFMPEALSSHPTPYRHHWQPGDNYNDIYTGWSYPPADYAKWGELIDQLGRHVVARYGREEVDSWYFEVWNEPDIGYWHGTPEEYQKLFDFARRRIEARRADGKVGGPRHEPERAAAPADAPRFSRALPPRYPTSRRGRSDRRSTTSASTPRAHHASWTVTSGWGEQPAARLPAASRS